MALSTLLAPAADAAPTNVPSTKAPLVSSPASGLTAVSQTNSAHLAAAAGLVPLPNPLYRKGYKLIKNWDFGESIKTDEAMRAEFFTRYVYEGGKLDTLPGNKEWQRYRDNDNHRLGNSTLKLVAHVRNGLVDGGIESGMLRSHWTGKYGYFECRLKVPAGRGLWPAFWLNPHDEKWPPEIDIMEIVDNGRDSTKNSFHFVHSGKADTATTLRSKLDQWHSYRPGFDYKDDFHTFAVEWTPDTVTHYVDEVEVVSRRFGWKHDDGSDGGSADVLLNLAVGGTWPGPPSNLQDFPAILEVDYIRVWQK